MKNRSLIAATCSLALLSSAALAQSTAYDNDDDSGLYLGASYGYLKVDGDDDFDDDKDAYQLFVGYGFNEFIAIEGSYIDFGDYGSDLANADTDGYTLGLKVSLPITEKVYVFAKGGQLWADTDYNLLGVESSSDDEGLFAGLGIGYKINKDWAIKLDYTLYDNDLDIDQAVDDIDDANFSTDLKHAAVGFEYKF
jgi:hypothetical protein